MPFGDLHQQLRSDISQIQQNSSLDLSEKDKLIQDHLQQFNRIVSLLKPRDCSRAGKSCEDVGRFPGKEADNCIHYQRGCWIKANCCNRYYPCRRCHDAAEDHEIDRHATKFVGCKGCGAEDQPVGPNCNSCHMRFARYFCSICLFFDDEEGSEVYHCEKCGICRVGKGLGIDNVHCERCDVCVPMAVANSHPCRELALDCACPICNERMAQSTEQVVFALCGHAMHSSCFVQHTKSRYTCPVCLRSLADMSNWIKEVDAHLEKEPIPEEWKCRRTPIVCNDCQGSGQARFHYMYRKCSQCGSYNTRVTGPSFNCIPDEPLGESDGEKERNGYIQKC